MSDNITRKKFNALAKQFCEKLDNATEEQRKEMIENLPDKKLRRKLKKIYKIS